MKYLDTDKIKKSDYKKTKLGWIPENWDVKSLGDCSIIKGDYGINAPAVKYSNELPTYLRISDIDESGNFIQNDKKSVNIQRYNKYKLVKGDIVFARTGGTVGKTYLHKSENGDLIFAGFLIRFRTNPKILLSDYLKAFTTTKHYWNWVKTISRRSGQPGINGREYSQLSVIVPPVQEQKIIMDVLSTWNLAIENLQKLIELKELRKKGLMQQLLTGKKRFSEFSVERDFIKTKIGYLPKDWKLRHISNIVDRIRKSFIPEPSTVYQEIGIRSHTKGIFYKKKVIGTDLGSKSVFWIEPNCFILNIVFAWEHAITKTTENEKGMIASHRFPMYKPRKDLLDLDFLLNFFQSSRGKHLLGLASPGGAGRNKTLGQSDFLKLKIPTPSYDEQCKISHMLKLICKEIDLLNKKLEVLKQQKKGLMQVLLTGKVRVNMDTIGTQDERD